jgi:hypothetical protein
MEKNVNILLHTCPKGNKEKKKEIEKEIEKMKNELTERQEKELSDLESRDMKIAMNILPVESKKKPRVSKAQKRRELKEKKAEEEEKAVLNSTPTTGQIRGENEMKLIIANLNLVGLKIFHIKGDGNCLYRSIIHQIDIIIPQKALPIEATRIRNVIFGCEDKSSSKEKDEDKVIWYMKRMIGNELKTNRNEEYELYITNEDEDTDDENDDEKGKDKYEKYIYNLVNRVCCGGNVELYILSRLMKVKVIIIYCYYLFIPDYCLLRKSCPSYI